MANVKEEQLSLSVKTITFSDEGHEITFCLTKDKDKMSVYEKKNIGIHIISKVTTLSKKWVVENILPAIYLLKDSGRLEMKTPLTYDFIFTKDNLKTLADFINSK